MNIFTFVFYSLFSLFIFHDPSLWIGMLIGTHYEDACYFYYCYACVNCLSFIIYAYLAVLCDLWNELETLKILEMLSGDNDVQRTAVALSTTNMVT